jgi:hypothetical protein
MNLTGPDFLLAVGFALLGAGLGVLCGIGFAFWIAGAGPARLERPRTPKP